MDIYYKRKREKFLNFLGNKCNFCGSKKNLNIDHIVAKNKKFRYLETGIVVGKF